MDETLKYKFISNGKYGAYLKINDNLNISIPKDININDKNLSPEIVLKLMKIKDLKDNQKKLIEDLKTLIN